MNIMIVQLQVICSEITDGSLLSNCSMYERFLNAALLPFEYITGGYISAIFWGVIVGAVYLKYHSSILAALVGIPVLLISSIVLPSGAEVAIPLLIITTIAVAIYYIVYRMPRAGQ